MIKISNRHKKNLKAFDTQKQHTSNEGVGVLRLFDKAKFDETVDIAMRLGIDPNQADQQIRGSFNLPHGTGKSRKVVVFARGDKAEEARSSGADRVGGEELIKEVENGWMDFDVAIATPELMPLVGKLGRVLGPQGKMPSPKSGTVTDHIALAVKECKAGRIEYRNDKAGNLHVPVGRFSFTDQQLEENINAFVDHVKNLKPASSKGAFIRSLTLSSTMGPGVKLAVED